MTPGGAGRNGEKETVDEGYSWEGVEVFVPKGEDPERMVREAQEKKRKEAEKEAAARKARSGGASGSPRSVSENAGTATKTRKGGTRRRGIKELMPVILVALHRLTGEKFTGRRGLERWFVSNSAAICVRQAALDDKEKAQKKAARAKK